MKTITLALLSLTIIPKLLSAQPTVTNNEFYNIGDVVNMIAVEAAGVQIDTPSANATWDYSNLTSVSPAVTNVSAPGTVFGTSNIQITLPNGDIQYLNENSTDSYENGFVDHGTHDTVTFTYYDISKRPFTYLQTFRVDTYKVSANTPRITGIGFIIIKGDAWGTLKLPTGTYPNVLRIRKYDQQSDTVSGSQVVVNNVTYQWFDDAHKAPLLELDSTTSYSGATSITAKYLASPEGVATVNNAPQHVNAYIADNDLVLTSMFENGATYDVTVYSIIGTKIYTGNFNASGNTQRIETGRDIVPGIYIVSVSQRNDPSSAQIIKVVKQ